LQKLENEPHFLRFRALTMTNPPQTISSSFMGPHPRARIWSDRRQTGAGSKFDYFFY
jgi:hypothetical protein